MARAAQWFIVHCTGQAQRRRARLNSNVRPQTDAMRSAAAATKLSSLNSVTLSVSLCNRNEQSCRASSRSPKTTKPPSANEQKRRGREAASAALRGRPGRSAKRGLLVSWSVPPPGHAVPLAKARSGGGRGRSRGASLLQSAGKQNLLQAAAHAWARQVRELRPNHSFKRGATGRPPSPVRRYAVHCRQTGLGGLPASPA